MREIVIGEFESAEDVVRAAGRLRELGYSTLEAYGPFPVPELDEALARRRSRVPMFALLGGAGGASLALFLQWWMNAFDYPLDVGGRPVASWPTYVIIMFEATVLVAAFGTFAAVLLGSRLPRLHDDAFDLPGFERTTIDRFWLTIGDPDPMDDSIAQGERIELREALTESGAVAVRDLRRQP
jgi:hypothetical protein